MEQYLAVGDIDSIAEETPIPRRLNNSKIFNGLLTANSTFMTIKDKYDRRGKYFIWNNRGPTAWFDLNVSKCY